MQKWSANHWLSLAIFLAGFGAIISGLTSWSEALTPSFIGGALVSLGGVLRAIYSAHPNEQ